MLQTTRIGMALDEFMAQDDAQPFELINGEKILKMPNPYLHSLMIRALFRLLDAFARETPGVEVFFETTFILPDSYDNGWVAGSRIPNLMVFTDGKVAYWQANTPKFSEKPLAVVPDLVIEIISVNDKYVEIDEKIDAYLADGVRLVITLDPQRKKAVMRRPNVQPAVFTEKDTLDVSDVLPGFQIKLSELFSH